MKQSLELKLQQLLERFQEIGQLLSDASIIADQNQFKALSKEYAQLEPVATHYGEYSQAVQEVNSLQELIDGTEQELAEMASGEIDDAHAKVNELEELLQWHLIPKDPDDARNSLPRSTCWHRW